MHFSNSEADAFVTDPNLSLQEALVRTTHLCIGAHPDDIEAMACHGILACFGRTDRWFSGITVTNGSGSARTGAYSHLDDAELAEIRRQEQRKAAVIGDYSVQIQLGYSSAEAKTRGHHGIQDDLARVLTRMHPQVVYLHQPADKHETHVAVLAHSLQALRALPPDRRPARVYGCEGWRGLDWLGDDEKQLLDVSALPGIAASLLGVFDSQNSSKRFDLAVPARRRANAVFHTPHLADACDQVTWATDLTPLVHDVSCDVHAFVQAQIERFRTDVSASVRRYF